LQGNSIEIRPLNNIISLHISTLIAQHTDRQRITKHQKTAYIWIENIFYFKYASLLKEIVNIHDEN